MGIDAKHPQFEARLEDYEQLTDCYKGEKTIKAAGTKYLPATSSMEADGMTAEKSAGRKAYEAYKKRAVYHDILKDAIEAMVGIMHREPATIQLPKRLEAMLKKATVDGESLQTLLRRINEGQLLHGRFGLLVDVPDGAKVNEAVPYISPYGATNIINWDVTESKAGSQRLNMVVLDETGYERNDKFEWETKQKHRLLATTDLYGEEGEAKYGYVVRKQDKTIPTVADLQFPSLGGNELDQIPFVMINAADLVPSPDEPPLLGLSNLSLAIYRGEADYRLTLFLQGQETLVITNADDDSGEESEPRRVGAGQVVYLPEGGDAKYVGASADGLTEQREALQNDKTQAAQKSAQLLDHLGSEAASGEALRVRVAAQTASLTQIAKTGAEGLQEALRICATWVGADPEEVVVTPNLDFADDEMTGQDLLQLMQAKAMGAPISNESIHRLMKKRDLTDKEFEEEMDLIEEEELNVEGTGVGDDADDESGTA